MKTETILSRLYEMEHERLCEAVVYAWQGKKDYEIAGLECSRDIIKGVIHGKMGEYLTELLAQHEQGLTRFEMLDYLTKATNISTVSTTLTPDFITGLSGLVKTGKVVPYQEGITLKYSLGENSK